MISNLAFQEQMTEWCWGFGWGDETINAKTRSMMNLTMIAALGKMHEWELHLKGALNNGVSKLHEVFIQTIPERIFSLTL